MVRGIIFKVQIKIEIEEPRFLTQSLKKSQVSYDVLYPITSTSFLQRIYLFIYLLLSTLVEPNEDGLVILLLRFIV